MNLIDYLVLDEGSIMRQVIKVGICPGIKKSSVALMVSGRLFNLESMKYRELTQNIKNEFNNCYYLIEGCGRRDTYKIKYFIENPEKIKNTWCRPNLTDKERHVVKSVSHLLVEHLEFYKCQFELIDPHKFPLEGCMANNNSFNTMMGWGGRSNMDTRRAACMLFPHLKSCTRNLKK